MTSFEKIYKDFLFQIEDDGIGYLSKEEFYEALEGYLLKSAVLDFKNCRTELDYQPNREIVEVFYGNGLTDTFFLSNKLKNDIYHSLLVIDGVVLDDCMYSLDGSELHLNFNPNPHSTINLTVKEIGYFTEELTKEEESILAEIMVLHWIRKQIVREDNLKASISTSDYKRSSSANMLDKLIALQEKQEEVIRKHIISYSQFGFEGFN